MIEGIGGQFMVGAQCSMVEIARVYSAGNKKES
jgi:hypothetical protein